MASSTFSRYLHSRWQEAAVGLLCTRECDSHMSSVSGVGNNSLYQWLQALTGNSSTSAISSTSSTPAQGAAQDPFQALAGISGGGGHHHHHGGFAQKIESAVTTALQNAPSGSDPNQVIKDAITQALQAGKPGATGAAGNDGDGDDQDGVANSSTSGSSTLSALSNASGNAFTQLLQSVGVTGQQFQQDFQSALATAGTASGGSTVSGISSASDAAFSQLLQSYGVSSQQFQQDLQSALAGGSTGSSTNGINFATLFKSFPPGSFIQAVG